MGLKPIKKRRLFEEIIVAIEEYIEEEDISSGERLPSENELASLFQVSKTAVREAMSVLQANGIIEKRSGAGIFLTDLHGDTIAGRVTSNLLSQKDYREILEFRRGLEVEAAALAAVNATEEDLSAIREAQRKLLEAQTTGRLGLEEDFLFHYSIILASHNSIYKEVFDNVADKFEEGIRISKLQSSKVPGRFVEVYEEHNDILEGVKSRDPKKAADAMRNHLIKNEKKIWSNRKVKKEPL
ncbi:FCD domain-containing protein [Fictibacillus enclensis]|uniref:FadR/GntR family transcriptional regulator n=1 Tax=Fictibacillus enclensis TaxID=1017270 RepID=UPI0025A20974|nr:FCD domain-containing protein [Fictibacillus enclensis]MDM5340453.1 FCD domain-containing protein [Fictibacillus enclensis]